MAIKLREVVTFKYLGVWISSNLSILKLHAPKPDEYMYRTFAPYSKPDTIISLYKSQVLPILDYASVVWEPHLKKDKLLLEAVQLQATRMASRQWKENSVSLNQRFELLTLESRRKYFKLLLTYKFLSGYILIVPQAILYNTLTQTLDCFILNIYFNLLLRLKLIITPFSLTL